MAINKNNFKNAEGNYEAKNALMDAVIDGVNENSADYANLLAGGTPVKLTLQNGWTGDLYVKRNALGQVTIYGAITTGTVTSGTIVADLPANCIPLKAGGLTLITNIPAYVGRTGVRNVLGLLITQTNQLAIYEPLSDTAGADWNMRINFTYQSEI